jgi:hypothetical protein
VPAERVVEQAQTLINTIFQLSGEHQPGDRAVAIQVLAAVERFLRLGEPLMHLGCCRPILDLMFALEDLDCGKVSPLVRPRKTKGRARDPRRARTIRAMAAGFVDVLIAMGAREQEALRDVAGVLYQHGFPFPGTIESAKRRENTVDEWRHRIRRHRARKGATQDPDVDVYDFTQKDNAPRAGELPNRARRRAMFTFAGMLEQLGFEEKKGTKVSY